MDVTQTPISFPEPAIFLRRLLDENEGSGKDQFLADPDWLSEMQYNTISPLFANYSFSSSMRRKKLAGLLKSSVRADVRCVCGCFLGGNHIAWENRRLSSRA